MLVFVTAAATWVVPDAHGFGVFGVKQNGGAGFLSVSADARYVVWETTATNLSPADPDTVLDVYVRDTDTGSTVLASRATGATGVKANGEARYPSISGDGRYVAFMSTATNLDPADTDTQFDIYVRDLQTDTTELVSRPSGNGPKASALNSWEAELSHDGRFVVFGSNQALTPDDGGQGDVFVRDTQLDTTILASRANGASGVAGALHETDPAISADGAKVAFLSFSTGMAPGDTDMVGDVFVRDLTAGSTTLVSRATGASGVKGNAASGVPSLSADGRVVAFNSTATNLGGDTDGILDVFARDVQANTTTLVSRATGAAGVKGNANSGMQAIDHYVSGDGNRVAFRSSATNLGDPDSTPSIFVRDLQAATTTLASRASGPAGASSNSTVDSFSLAEGGRYVAFVTGQLDPVYDPDFAGDVYIRDLQDELTHLESRGAPIYVRPKGASPLRVPLVPAFDECTAPNREHGPPLAHPSCNPPSYSPDHAAIGTPDFNAKPLGMIGSLRLGVVNDNTSTAADEADTKVIISVTDVRAMPGLGDYTGGLDARLPLRLTDRSNGPSAAETGTTQDTDFRVAVPCTTTTDTSIGSTCAINTTVNAIAPGAIKGGRRAIWALGKISVFDAGADGAPGTAGDNTLFAVQGIFVP